MLYLKDNPIGVDEIIQFYQKKLYESFKTKWNISDIQYDSYGRVYRNNTDSGYKPEVFISSLNTGNTTYKEVYFDNDVNSVVSFFDVGDNVKYDFGHTDATGAMIFILNIQKLKPNLAWRGDEEVKKDIIQEIQFSIKHYSPVYRIDIVGFETGYRNVFKNFDGLLGKDPATYRDRHPIYNIKVNLNIHYNLFNS